MPYASLSLQAPASTFIFYRNVWELYAPQSSSPMLMELSLFFVAGAAAVYGLGIPSSLSVMPSSTLFENDNPNDPPTHVSAATSFATPGGYPTQFYRRGYVGSFAGEGLVWTFPRGLSVQPGYAVALAITPESSANTGTTDINAVIEE